MDPKASGRSLRLPTSPATRILGWLLVAVVVTAFLFLGGVRPGAQAGLHGMVALAAALAAVAPSSLLQRAGVTIRLGLAALLPFGAVAFGLLPVPRGLAALIAPGRLLARPDDAWVSLATDPGKVPAELATLALVLGFGLVVATWGAVQARQSKVETAVTALTALVATSALAHAALGARSMLGAVAPDYVPTPFFAPFVDGNHAASVMLLGGSVALGTLANDRQGRWIRRGAAVTALLAIAVLLWVFSTGALVAAAVALVVWVLRRRNLLRAPVVLAGAAAVTVVQLRAGNVAWQEGSVAVRARLWQDAVRLFADHWLAGAGGGTFGEAIRPYRSDTAFFAIAHAHSDPLEWLAETGLVGLVALVAFALVARPGPLRDARRADALVCGLLALGVHALVDFPLQIPAIALSAAGVAACLVAVSTRGTGGSPRAVRVVLATVAVLQLPAAAWRERERVVDAALVDVASDDAEVAGAAARTLAGLHAGEAARALLDARRAADAGDAAGAVERARAVVARYPDSPDALRGTAAVLAREGEWDEATAVLSRVTERDPSDYRAWVALARVATAQHDSALAAKRWAEAFRREAPTIDEAYAAFPLGLHWLDAVADMSPRYSLLLARKLAKEGDLEVAEMAYEQAARLDPARYGDQLERAAVLVKLGRAAEAERWLRDVLTRRPDDPLVYAQLGTALDALGRPREAAEAWLRASSAVPSLRLRALRSTEAASGPAEALKIARRLELEGSLDPEMRLEIARLRRESGDRAGCVQDIERWRLTTNAAVGKRAEQLVASCRGP